ncbi:MAG: hypothetical protein JRJ85_01230 [Deltaproteobacteria bacterium]|nr:hypothetical protein [Deltaproteobacteria bacterium]
MIDELVKSSKLRHSGESRIGVQDRPRSPEVPGNTGFRPSPVEDPVAVSGE